jgi:hypothetical protein
MCHIAECELVPGHPDHIVDRCRAQEALLGEQVAIAGIRPRQGMSSHSWRSEYHLHWGTERHRLDICAVGWLTGPPMCGAGR